MVRIIAYFLFACIEIYMMDMLFSSISKKRLKGTTLIIFMCAAITVNTVVSYFFAGTGVMLLALGLLTAFVFALVYKVKVHFAIICSILFVMIQAGTETMITLISGMLMGEVTLDFLRKDYIFLGMGLICKFFSFILIFFISKKINKVDLGVSKGLTLLLLIQPIATVFVTLVILKCTYELDSIPAILFSSVAILMIAANIVTLFLIYRQKDYIESKERLNFANEQIKNQLIHYEELYRYQSEIRTFRHDIKNKLLSIGGLIKDAQYSSATEAIRKEVIFLDETNNSIINSGNPVVDAVVQSKLALAESKGIKIDFSIKLSEIIAVDPLKLGVLIGNTLDNAIEATEHLDDSEKKTVFAKLATKGGRIVFSVENYVKETIDTKNITTLKPDKLNHGYGIKSIKTVAEKYDGNVFVSCENEIFTVSINILNTFEH